MPATYVRLLFDYLAARGIDAAALLGEPPPDAGELGRGRYPIARWSELLATASRELDDPLLGIHVGATITPRHVGALGYVVLACGTLGAALARYQRFEALFYDIAMASVRETRTTLEVVWDMSHGRPGALVDECAIAAFVQFGRDIAALDQLAGEVHFVYPAPDDLAPYEEFFGCPVKFGQAANMVSFPRRYLAHPLRSPDPLLLELLERQADALLAKGSEHGIDRDVRHAIARLVRDGEPTLPSVARELHVSPRTLHRRLEERNLNFRTLLDDTRRRLAEDHLRDPRLELTEIAHLLGFSDQSAFSRAFKRWTGKTPREFRARLAR